MRNAAPSMALASDDVLARSMNDARQLLWYATREGRELPTDIVDAIIAAESVLRTGNRDPEVEGRFWLAFRNLAAAVRPVSVDSIVATYGVGDRRSVAAESTKRRYSIFAVIVLVILLVTQIYWFVGNSLKSDLEAYREEQDRLSSAMWELDNKMGTLSEQLYAKQQERENVGTAVDPTNLVQAKESLQSLKDLDKEISDLNQQFDAVNTDFANKDRRDQRLALVFDSNGELLDRWDFITEIVAPEASRRIVSPDGSANAAEDNVATKLSLLSVSDPATMAEKLPDVAPSGQVDPMSVRERLDSERKRNELTAQQKKLEKTLLSAKSVNAVLTQYLLPLLYGLLGSLAYILRTLSTEIQQVTFTRSSRIRYSLRWPLGMLGGVTVGLFFDPESLSGIGAIKPLGLAFLAGYGVELLFTGLDGLVQAFTGERTRSPTPT